MVIVITYFRVGSGKPKYFSSRKKNSDKGVRIESLPDEFEIYENPRNATVTIRRSRSSRVAAFEHELVSRLVAQLSACSSVQTQIEEDSIVIYTANTGTREIATFAETFEITPARAAAWINRTTDYSAEMRFTLRDVDERLYVAERFCYRGGFDRWIHIAGPAPLESLATTLVHHLGRESFFELR